ncbi:nesprin-3 [Pristis pectinata]|uniref:nesprin-3 n=1 Tax=Pristis pectinata TaxID=685728 RepID=UPI00223D3209|nr:nesprin-3 [Pristis pectinata]
MKEKYNSCISHKNSKDHVDGSLKELRELSDAVVSREGELDNLKTQAEAVIKNTSPKGAEDINRNLEQLRTDWENLRLKCQQDQGPLQHALQSVLEHQSRAQQLEREVVELLDRLQILDLEPPDENEPEIVWRNCLLTRSSILAEESRVEELHLKLKDLGKFSQNEKLSAKVLDVIREYNRVKGKIIKRCSQLMENLRQGFQELLKEFEQWRNSTRNLLDSSLDTNDEMLTRLYLQHIEDYLASSSELQVQFDRFRGLEGMMNNIFSSEQTAAFGAELREALWQREFFTDLLIKRRGQIQEMRQPRCTPQNDGERRDPENVQKITRQKKHQGANLRSRTVNNQDLASHKLLMQKFEDWLKSQDQKLANILAANNARSSREMKRRKQGLKVLNCHVPRGQKIFEELISAKCAGVNEEEKQLEDLRYRWILYKTKLSEAGELLIQGQDEVDEFGKTSGGICHYLSRACCAALPLQLLLLLLLLLAFLLPLIEEQDSCSVVNNFARSFYLTLRYQGPPPT